MRKVLFSKKFKIVHMVIKWKWNRARELSWSKQLLKLKKSRLRGLLKVDPSVRKLQEEKIRQLKATRDNDQVAVVLQELRDTAETDENLMPVIIKCVKAYCTLGEICDALRTVFGEYKASINI